MFGGDAKVAGLERSPINEQAPTPTQDRQQEAQGSSRPAEAIRVDEIAERETRGARPREGRCGRVPFSLGGVE